MLPSEFIKQRTSGVHRELERSSDVTRWLTDVGGYAEFLTRTLHAIDPIERWMNRTEDSFANQFPFRSARSDELRHDLQWFQGRPEQSRMQEVRRALKPLSFELPVTLPTLAGVAYVLEGSSLGSQVLLKMVEKNLKVVPPDAARYLRGNGDQTRDDWRRFQSWFNDSIQSVEDNEAALVAALQAFRTFKRAYS